MKKFYLCLCCFLVFLNGCGNSPEEKALEKKIGKATGTKTDVNTAEKGMTISGHTEGDKLAATTGKSIEILEAFPTDVLLYQPAEALTAVEVPDGYSVTLTTEDDITKVTEDYKNEMPARGWAEQAVMVMGGQTVFVYEKEGRVVNITAMPLDGKTTITVTISKN